MWGQVVAYKRLKTMKIIMPSPQTVVALAYERWSFTRMSNYRALTGKIWCLDRKSHIGGGRLREVVAHGGSIVLHIIV